jgi:hypothetical protein
MDLFKQVNKQIKKIRDDTAVNSHRYKENFPQIERKVDEIAFDNSYKLEFRTSDHPHTVTLNFRVKPPTTCFRCNINSFTTGHPGDIRGIWTDMTFPSLSGTATPAQWATNTTNTGGFTNTSEGIVVPQDGIYNANWSVGATGVTVNDLTTLIFSVRHNGVIQTQVVYSVSNGKLPASPNFYSISPVLNGLCMTMRAGDVVNGWLAAGGGVNTIAGTINVYRVALL